MKENIKENKKTNTKAQNDLSLLFKYRKFLMGFAALWILMTHEWQIVTNETSFFFVTENFIKIKCLFWIFKSRILPYTKTACSAVSLIKQSTSTIVPHTESSSYNARKQAYCRRM